MRMGAVLDLWISCLISAICAFYVVLDKGGIHCTFQKSFKPFSAVKLAISVV